jgi:hypothetical protein
MWGELCRRTAYLQVAQNFATHIHVGLIHMLHCVKCVNRRRYSESLKSLIIRDLVGSAAIP